jgi:hypothetical protein
MSPFLKFPEHPNSHKNIQIIVDDSKSKAKSFSSPSGNPD